jgi:hypothetical protein
MMVESLAFTWVISGAAGLELINRAGRCRWICLYFIDESFIILDALK